MSTHNRNPRSDQNFIAGVANVIYTHDPNGNLTFLNGRGEQPLGYSCEEARQQNIARLMMPEIRGALRDQVLSGATQKIGSVYEIEVIAKDGRRLSFEISTSLVFRIGESSQTARAFPDSHRARQNS